MNLFNLDNPIMTFLGKVFDVMLLSVIWLICSIPIVTIGASTTALYYAIVKNVRKGRGYATKEFFKSFKSNFKNATILTIISIIFYSLMVGNIYIVGEYVKIGSMSKKFTMPLVSIYWALIIIYTFIFVYLFPLLSRFNMNKKQLFKSAFFISVRHFPYTIGIVLILVAGIFSMWFFPVLFIFIPGIVAVLSSFLLEKIMLKYIPKKEKKFDENGQEIIEDNVDEWYFD